ncbi:MAG: exo-beta-N-acetylmuramidase NamZ domain-containing protein, partial [Pyrinomonadaceae bacterium]
MFERYTEKARRVIFFARYEASQFGAPAIEPEHLLLGLMREDKTLVQRFFPARKSVEGIRREIEERSNPGEKISTSVELPLAPETKRVLGYAHEESDRLNHRHIGTEHLLLGLLREERSVAAEILYERGLRLNGVREEVSKAALIEESRAAAPKHFLWLEEIQACADRVLTLSKQITQELSPETGVGAQAFHLSENSSKNYQRGQGSLVLSRKHLRLGLETLLQDRLELLRGARIGLICNQASVDHRLRHAADLFQEHSEVNLKALFGPQHGIRGEVQDNMVETGHAFDKATGVPLYSLYSETREPTEKMLEDVDVLVFDLQDVGCRIYTFIYTLANCMRAAERFGKKVVVCDRPNPITGESVAGTVLEPEFASFVGQFPIATRHGMTMGELAGLFNEHFKLGCELEVIKMDGWSRELWMDETDAPWVLPSPNMPTIETTLVFPGTVHLEGTQISEGRGTTRPFELIGAPYIEPTVYADKLNGLGLGGVYFRPCGFQPTFQKHARENCGGVQVHVTDRAQFEPVLAGVAAVKFAYDLYTDEFHWKEPPYEYVYDKNPFDVIAGTDK